MTTERKARLLLFRCAGLSKRSSVVVATVEAALHRLVDRRDLDDMGGPLVDREWMHDYIHAFLSSPFDHARFTASDQARRDNEVLSYGVEVEEWLGELVRTNWDALEDVRHNLYQPTAHVLKRLPNLWIIELKDSQL